MKTITVSTTYNVKGFINNSYVMTECGKIINVKLWKEVKPVLRGNKAMYWIDGKFQNDFKLNTNRVGCPF
jgi:hypothetical protein